MKGRVRLFDLSGLLEGVRAGQRAVIARAITLIESRRPDHQKTARRLVQELLPLTGNAVRVGITPGRVSAWVAAVQRVLNVDSYGILELDEASQTVTLNRQLLMKQFRLG